ncbi:MAG TPA: OmpA family protein [Thermoanaerobaculia bacterium]|nr:OmpA family protein [Thermoanaerobaculia bacterium]
MRLTLFLALAFVSAAVAQETPQADAGPPYQVKILDLVFNIVDMGGRVEDLAVKETETEVRIAMAADVLFEFDKADLLPKAEATLAKAAAMIGEKAKGGRAKIEGHTDGKGSDAYNLRLSQRRAESVRRWFQTHGLSQLSFTTEGYGAKRPVAPNTKPDGSDDAEGRSRNRRVEIVITK